MIQPAAAAISSSLAPTTGAACAPADESAVSGGFSALLSSSMDAGADGASDAAAALEQAAGLHLRQAGKETGNGLPLVLPDADPTLAQATSADSSSAGTTAAAATKLILPGLILSVRGKTATADEAAETPPAAEQSTAHSLVIATAAQLVRSPRAAPTDTATKPPKSPSAKQDKTDADDAADGLAATAATIVVAAPVQPTTEVKPTQQPQSVETRPGGSQINVTTTSAEAAVQPQVETARTPLLSASALPTPAVQNPAATIRVAPVAAKQGSSTAALTIDGKPQDKPVDTIVVPLAADQSKAAAPQPDDAARKAIDALPRAASGSADPALASAEASAPRAAALVADAAESQSPPVAAAAPQPTLSIQDVQPVPQTSDPATAAPAITANHQTGHDFATLVDRLVEAREAALPQAVHAAVSHSEFGQVSLRFDQDASGLSVSMSSADPDFARAVQATASSAGSQTASDNGQSAPRQDASTQQQTAGSLSGQAQPQSDSQASARNDRNAPTQNEARAGGRSAEQGHDDDSADTRSGIYA
jgi:hypothetical protein